MACGFSAGAARAGVLDDVKERGTLRCGVDAERAGFAVKDALDVWSGFDVDYCLAIAAAVLGDGGGVELVPLTIKQRFRALQSGEVDVLFRGTSWTMARDTSLGLTFAGVTYHDGQGFMVPRSLGVDLALQLTGAKVCIEPGARRKRW